MSVCSLTISTMQKLLVALLVAHLALSVPLAALAQDVKPNFNPSILIPDASFNDLQTFGGPEGIQRFLESKGSVLANTSPDFLVKLSEPNDPALKAKLDDPQPNLPRLRTAAEIIWDASRASGINPQVILVTLNKEQSLITGNHAPDRLQRALNHAMGFDCPDSSGCGNLFPGFYFQLMGNVDTEGNRYLGAAKSLMKSFNTPEGRGPATSTGPAKVGQTIAIENTLGDFAGIFFSQNVTIGNRATAALYRYTPHVFNGNYNFWRFFTEWFKYANGTLLSSTQDGFIYIIEDGARKRVPSFVAAVRGLNLATAVSASPTELADYPPGPLYGPPDNTIVNENGTHYVFVGGVRHPVSPFVLAQRKLDVGKSMPIAAADAALFPAGAQLTPSEGTVLRGIEVPDVYLVENGVLKKYSEFTFAQHKAGAKLQRIPDSEVASYPKQGYVAPLDGTVIQDRAKTGVYLMSKQRRLPLTPELLKNRKITAKQIVTLSSDEEIASIPIGPPATPAEGTYFTAGGPREFYLFKDGAKHPISPFVAKQRGMTPDFAFESSVASSWPEGIAIAPRNGSLVKGDASATVYLITNGQRQEVHAEVAKTRKLNLKTAAAMPQADLEALAKDGFATPAENTYFSTGKNGPVYVFKKGAKQLITPFVAKQRGMTPDYAFPAEAAADWADGTAISPRDGTLVQASGSSTVYVVEKTLLRSLTTAAFKRKGYSTKNVKVVPASELNAWAKGEPILK
jgi:hypothetical protein